MKKLIITFIILLFSVVSPAQNLTVNVIIPPVMPFDLDAWRNNPGLIQVLVTNSSPVTLTNYRLGWKTIDTKTGIVAAQTKDESLPPANFPPGTTSYPAGQLIFLPAVEIDETYKTQSVTTNTIPESDYTFCVYILNENNQIVSLMGNTCAYFQILIPESVSLLNPADNDVLQNNSLPLFMWTPVLSGAPVKYNLKVVPVYQGQSKYDAILTNPVFLQKSVMTPSYQFNLSDPPFDFYPQAISFAWQVQATDNQNVPVTQNNGNSDVFQFVFANNNEEIEVDITSTGCKDNEFDLEAMPEGGSGNYTYKWTKNGTVIPQTTKKITGLTGGKYKVTVTDAVSSKTASKEIEISQIYISASASKLQYCFSSDGKIYFINRRVSGGSPKNDAGKKIYNYTIKKIAPDNKDIKSGTVQGDMPYSSPDFKVADSLYAGVYRITVTDEKGCTAQRDLTIESPDSKIDFSVYKTNPECITGKKGKIRIGNLTGFKDYSPKYTVEYKGPNGFNKKGYKLDSVTNLEPGEYFITVTDTSSIGKCFKIKTSILENSTLSADVKVFSSGVTQDGANDGVIRLVMPDIYSKVKSVEAIDSKGNKVPQDQIFKEDDNKAYRISGLKPETYKIKIKIDDNCFVEKTVKVSDCSKPQFSISLKEEYVLKSKETFTVVLSNMVTGNTTFKFTAAEDGKKKPNPFVRYVNTKTWNQLVYTKNFEEGEYELEVTDVRGCVQTLSFNVYNKAPECKPDATKWVALNIAPIFQLTPMWCWATCGEMVFRYYNVPNVNPGGVYQCGIIGIMLGGACNVNCAVCSMVGAPSMKFMTDMIKNYSNFASKGNIKLTAESKAGKLTFDEVKTQIDGKLPIVAGVNTSGKNGPTEHVCVIIGYNETTIKPEKGGEVKCKFIKVNDPFPFNQFGKNPYVSAGGKDLGNGQYEILYDDFVNKLKWKETMFNIK